MTEQNDALILKFLSGIATDEEQQQLQVWVEQSSENSQLLEDYKNIWKADSAKCLPDFNSIEELEKLKATLNSDTTIRKFSLSQSVVYKVAASVALVMVCSFLLYKTIVRPDIIVKVSGDEKIHFTLPEGSVVWMNENSKVTYASDFNDSDRTLELTGEAFFEVTKNPNKPFVVRADKSEVKVLGTSFNVRAYKGEIQNEIYVVTGKVSLSDARDHSIVLKPGEIGILNKKDNSLVSNKVSDANLIAWKSKQLVFKQTSLSNVAATLEKYFEINIIVKNPDLQKCRFTSSFQDPTLEEVIEAISIALNIDIVHQNNKYTFDGKGC